MKLISSHAGKALVINPKLPSHSGKGPVAHPRQRLRCGQQQWLIPAAAMQPVDETQEQLGD